MRENACEPASQLNANIAVDKNVSIHFAVDKIVPCGFVWTILSQLRQLRRMYRVSVWYKSASLGQTGLSLDKIVSTYFYGTILSHDWIYWTNRNQACRASSRARQATNGGRGINMSSGLLYNNYSAKDFLLTASPQPHKDRIPHVPRTSTCTLRFGMDAKYFETSHQGDAGKLPKFDDLGSLLHSAEYWGMLRPWFCHMHLGTQYKYAYKVLDGVRVL